mmetsp:Transcript_6432/g.15606  ORF Transcript_6432/g.15606 Transcript_6432/m.15606 type:complete len:886 (-) Transcript_6432:39-2696(-)
MASFSSTDVMFPVSSEDASAVTLWNLLSDICNGMQVEIAIFAVAIAVHCMLFGAKFNPVAPKTRSKVKLGGPSPQKSTAAAARLMQLSEGWRLASSGSVSSDLRVVLTAMPVAEVDEALVDVLEGMGKQVTVEVCSGVRAALAETATTPSAHLAEILLRCMHQHGKMIEYDAFMDEVLARGIRSSGISLLALKVALKRSDAKTAVKRLGELKAMWQEKTTSAAPASLMQQVAKLAAESGETACLVEHLQEMQVTSQMLSAAVIEAARARDKEACQAMWVISQSSKTLLCVDAYASLMKTAKSVEAAMEIFNVTGVLGVRTVCHYNTLLDMCVESNDLHTAEKLMHEAEEKQLTDVVTYNTMVKAYLRSGSFQSARGVFATMQRAGVQPNAVTFNELLDAAASESPRQLWAIIDEMKACGQRPNHVTCSILLKSIHQHSRGGDVEKTLAVIEAMEGEMDEILLSSVVEACVRAGRQDLLKPLLARQHGPARVPIKGAHSYGSLIRAYGYLNDLNGAWAMWKEMCSRNIKATSITVGCMVEALVSNGQTDRAYELIQEIHKAENKVDNVLNVVIYCSVLKGFSHQKRFDRVWVVYQEMLSYKLEFSIVTYNALIDACARTCEMQHIPAILQDMEKQGVAPNLITYSTIIKGYCQESKLDKACQVVESMRKTTDLVPDEIMFNSLLDGCARRGLYDRGMAILKEMQESGIRPSNFTLSILAKLASRGKSVDAAFELCQKLAKENGFCFNTHVYNNLIHACVQHRNMPRAMDVFREFAASKLAPDARTFAVIIRGCIATSDWCTAVGLVRLALQLPADGFPIASTSIAVMKDSSAAVSSLVNELLEGLYNGHASKELAVKLIHDLKRYKPNLHVDARLKMKFTTSAMSS